MELWRNGIFKKKVSLQFKYIDECSVHRLTFDLW